MAADYPGSIPSIDVTIVDGDDMGDDTPGSSNVGPHSSHHIQLGEEVMAIAQELGVIPSGDRATVRERFEATDWKRSVVAATTAALPAATYATGPPATLTANANGALAAQDGISLAVNDRLFVKDQADPAQNGIYDVTSLGSGGTPWVLTRSTDADTALKMSDATYVAVQQGTAQSDTTWELFSDNPITLGTTALRFTRISPPYGAVQGAFRDPWMPTANPTKHQSMERSEASANLSALSTGRLSLFGGTVLRAGVSYNGIAFMTGTTALATGTRQWFTLVRLSDRAHLRSTVDDTSTAWAANTRKRLALSSPLIVDVDTPVYVGIMVAATTVPSLMGKANTLSVNINTLVPILGGTSTAALTTPVADGTIATALTADRNMPYFALD